LFARQPGAREVLVHALPDRRKRAAEFQQPVELGFVSDLAVAGMIPVLFAALCVPCGYLDMPVFQWADPHVAPARRNDECTDPFDDGAVMDGLAIGIDVAEPCPGG